jgi:peptidoglycan/LPS O-acetylase OafA/YrhL
LERRREAIEAGTAAVWPELRHFYENRIFRIWPIYFLLVFGLIVAGMTNIAKPLNGEEAFSLVTFTSNLFQSYVWGGYPEHFGALWSVAVEEQNHETMAKMIEARGNTRARSLHG